MAKEDDNLSNSLGSNEDEKLTLEVLIMEKDNIDLISKSFDTETYTRDMLSRCTPEDKLLESESS